MVSNFADIIAQTPHNPRMYNHPEDTSTAQTVAAVGDIALGVNRARHDNKLEGELETLSTRRLADASIPEMQEVLAQAERDEGPDAVANDYAELQTKLEKSKEIGLPTHEYELRSETALRDAKARMPGRANEFNQIYAEVRSNYDKTFASYDARTASAKRAGIAQRKEVISHVVGRLKLPMSTADGVLVGDSASIKLVQEREIQVQQDRIVKEMVARNADSRTIRGFADEGIARSSVNESLAESIDVLKTALSSRGVTLDNVHNLSEEAKITLQAEVERDFLRITNAVVKLGNARNFDVSDTLAQIEKNKTNAMGYINGTVAKNTLTIANEITKQYTIASLNANPVTSALYITANVLGDLPAAQTLDLLKGALEAVRDRGPRHATEQMASPTSASGYSTEDTRELTRAINALRNGSGLDFTKPESEGVTQLMSNLMDGSVDMDSYNSKQVLDYFSDPKVVDSMPADMTDEVQRRVLETGLTITSNIAKDMAKNVATWPWVKKHVKAEVDLDRGRLTFTGRTPEGVTTARKYQRKYGDTFNTAIDAMYNLSDKQKSKPEIMAMYISQEWIDENAEFSTASAVLTNMLQHGGEGFNTALSEVYDIFDAAGGVYGDLASEAARLNKETGKLLGAGIAGAVKGAAVAVGATDHNK